MKTLGFMVNPISGSGIYTGVNGSDMNPLIRSTYSSRRASKFLDLMDRDIHIVTAAGDMGEKILREEGFENIDVIYTPSEPSSGMDSKKFVELSKGRIDLLVFAGGDGTSRDIFESHPEVPVIGIPAGMKMYGSIYAENPEDAAIRATAFLTGQSYTTGDAVVEDSNEEIMLKTGQFSLKRYGTMKTVFVDNHIDPKSIDGTWDTSSVIEYVIDTMDNSYYVIGTGGTCKELMEKLGFQTSPFNIDIIKDGVLLKENAYPEDYAKYIKDDADIKIVVSPYAGSGFFLGRGNRQITSEVIMKAGKKNILIMCPQEKIRNIQALRYDVEGLPGDFFGKYIRVITGYDRFQMLPIS